MMLGAPSECRPATAETQQIADQVKRQLEEKENRQFPVFEAVECRTQVVAGTNHFIKVHVGGDEYIHLRVFESLPHENKPLTLSNYQTNKTKDDELEYF
ncbi:cystatin-B-like [Dasypus novemcinctus]|uniref:cystatin-B-like n=1 Tax=Dasypus novemcinctus TaxID=9361 RepID=UPI00265F7434|nr:cystatin-B-like [Dasypus novemcinctus]